MTTPKFAVGDTVILSDVRGNIEVTISRVGRKYAYIKQGHRESAFDLVTGHEKRCYNYVPRHIWTPAEWEEAGRRYDLVRQLRAAGITLDQRGFTTDTLARLLAVATEEQP